jgi:tripartite-type tricarboxylate transporter receptor subunit TctC
MKKYQKGFAVAVLALIAVAGAFAEGQKDGKSYPDKDIKLVINAGAGGGTDTILRKMASLIEKSNKVTLFAVNKPASAEAAGPFEVMNAPADGYTIGNLTYGSVVGAVWTKLIPQYDLAKLNVFCVITQEADALMVKADSPYKTYEDFIAAAKANPGKIKVGISANGGRPSMITTQTEELYGVKFNQIQYVEGAPQQREALLSGEADGVITSLGDFNAVLGSGLVRGLVEYSVLQNDAYPAVPTIKDKGYPDLATGSFIAMVAPKATPQPVIDALEKMFSDAQHSKEFRDWTLTVGVTPGWYGQAETAAFIKGMQDKAFKTLDDMKAKGLLK